MPTKESFRTAVALGLAAVFGAMATLTIMAGVLARFTVTGKEWSPEMTTITLNGASLMVTLGIVMVVLAVVFGVLGWMFSRNSARTGAV